MIIVLSAVILRASDNEKDLTANFVKGSPEIHSIKTLAFGPQGILFVGDNVAMTIFAIKIEGNAKSSSSNQIRVDKIDSKLAAMFGVKRDKLSIVDMVVHPESREIYLSVSIDTGGKAEYSLMNVSNSGKLSEVALTDVRYSEIKMKDAPTKDAKLWDSASRTYTFTDIAYTDGEVIVSGLSNEEFASSLRRIEFPFEGEYSTAGLQVYHVSHGRNETHAPIYRFLPYELGNEKHIIAGYMCTPLVTFPVSMLRNGAKIVGKTVAELGAGNAPMGIIAYQYRGEEYVLVGNNRHPLMKFKPQDLANAQSLVKPSRARGVKHENFKEGSIRNIADYNADNIVVINKESSDDLTLRSIPKSEL